MRRTALVIGAGSYVLGDAYGHGVVLPTLLDAVRAGDLDRILLAVRTPRDEAFHRRLGTLQAELGTEIPVEEVLFDGGTQLPADLPLTDAVAFVAIPDSAHAEQVEPLLRAGVPTWVVKPLTGSGAESQRLDRLARENDVPLWVDYHKRFDASNQKLLTLIHSGANGRLLSYSVQYSQPWNLPLGGLSGWAGDVDVFQYIGCHYVDLCLHLLPDARPTRVSATGLPGRLAREGGPAFDLVHVLLDLVEPDGHRTRADLMVGWNDPLGTPAKSHQRVECVFERGRVIADQKTRGFEHWHDDGFDQVNPYFFQILPDPGSGRPAVTGYGPESIRRFLAVYRDPVARACRGLPWSNEAVRTDQVLDHVHASLAENGAWIELPD